MNETTFFSLIIKCLVHAYILYVKSAYVDKYAKKKKRKKIVFNLPTLMFVYFKVFFICLFTFIRNKNDCLLICRSGKNKLKIAKKSYHLLSVYCVTVWLCVVCCFSSTFAAVAAALWDAAVAFIVFYCFKVKKRHNNVYVGLFECRGKISFFLPSSNSIFIYWFSLQWNGHKSKWVVAQIYKKKKKKKVQPTS